jgi:hypothetical protein
MSGIQNESRGPWLAPSELLFLGGVIFAWALFVLCLGKDMSWDFRNYHWYIPYAFLNGRMGFDVAVAHQATYYNPLLDVPYYLLGTHVPSWLALGTLGAVQGANVIPLYLLCRAVVIGPQRQLIAGVITLFCMTGSLTVGIAGTTYYDNVLSLFTLSGLAAIVLNRDLLRDGPLGKAALVTGLAGLSVGSAVGLKLPEAPYALGFAAALLVLPGDAKHRSVRLLAGGLGGLVGVVLFAGYWFAKMYHDTGNPLFPYFNQYFDSPLALHASYRDVRFIPHHFRKISLFPLLFSLHWQVADDLPFQDVRVGLAYVLGLLSLPLLFVRRSLREPLVTGDAAGAVIAFGVVSYIVWILMFGIYRYIVALEMLAPLFIAALIGMWPLTRYGRLLALGLIGAFVLMTTRYYFLDHAPLGDPFIQADVPPIADPGKSMILMTGEAPMGYLVPSLPHQIPVIRIDGWMIQPQDGSRLTAQTRARVNAFKGDLYVIANLYEVGRAGDALADYGLGMRWTECQEFSTNLGGPYKFCPLKHIPPKVPS